MCLTHIGGQYALPLNRTVYICLYLLLTSPGYSQRIPRNSFPYKGLIKVPDSHVLTCLLIYPDNCHYPESQPMTSSATTNIYFCMIFNGFSPWEPLYLTSMLTTYYKLHSFYSQRQWQKEYFCVRIQIPQQSYLKL